MLTKLFFFYYTSSTSLEIKELCFERKNQCKCLGSVITHFKNIREELINRLRAGNSCF